MNALVVTAKVLVLMACVLVLPFWLALSLAVPVLWSVGGSFALAVLLMVIWTQGRRT
jgi:hypothetical protein